MLAQIWQGEVVPEAKPSPRYLTSEPAESQSPHSSLSFSLFRHRTPSRSLVHSQTQLFFKSLCSQRTVTQRLKSKWPCTGSKHRVWELSSLCAVYVCCHVHIQMFMCFFMGTYMMCMCFHVHMRDVYVCFHTHIHDSLRGHSSGAWPCSDQFWFFISFQS